jgi:hypothetical protein
MALEGTERPFLSQKYPGEDEERGTQGIGHKVPHIGLPAGDKPLMDFIGYSESDDADHSQSHTFKRSGHLVEGSIQKNAQNSIFKRMQYFIIHAEYEGRQLVLRG